MNTNQPTDDLLPQDTAQKLQAEQQSKAASETDPATVGGGNLNPQNIDRKLAEDQESKTAADFDKTVRQANADTETRQPGASNGNNSDQHNNGRGGGK